MTRILTFLAEVILACVVAFAWIMLAFLGAIFVVISKAGIAAINARAKLRKSKPVPVIWPAATIP